MKRSAVELVTLAVHGHEEAGLRGPLLDLLAQLRHVHVHRARQRGGVVVPHGVEQLLAAHHLAAALDEVLEEAQLARRQIEGPAVPPHLATLEIGLDAAELERVEAGGAARGPPGHRPPPPPPPQESPTPWGLS